MDATTKLLRRARERFTRTDRNVTGLQAQIAHVAPNDISMRSRLASLLEERTAERDAAWQELEHMQSQPRWQLERAAEDQ